MLTDEPAWLVAWRQGRTAPVAPEKRRAQQRAAPRQGGSGTKPHARAVGDGSKGFFGFTKPKFEAWQFDGCKRCEPVLDMDYDPPRVVRQVGWRVCMCCAKPFWSDDMIRQRLCGECKAPPRGQRRTP